jgi:protein-tyrosine phosphatase
MKSLNLSGYFRLVILTFFALQCQAFGAQGLHESEAAARIPFEAASVTSSDGHVFVITWHAAHVRHIQIFAATDPTKIGRDRLVAEGLGAGRVTVANLPNESRWYFELVPDRGDPLIIADRSLHLTTAANFRDAGGYRTSDGKWVRMGLAYRSNGLEHLTEGELAQIDKLGIKLVCDLRTAEEILRGPDRVGPGVADVSVDVLADDADLIHAMMARGGSQTGNEGQQYAAVHQTGNSSQPAAGGGSPQEFEQRIYRDFVRLASARTAYRLLFERLADPDALPTVFHCTAGKDRTGWATAVFLTILGVPRQTIVQDYELTNEYLRGDALKSVRQSLSRSMRDRIVAHPASLNAAFEEVAKDYGSFDNYLHQGLGLSDAALATIRSNFLAE